MTKRCVPFFLVIILGLTALSCKTTNRLLSLFTPTPTPRPSSTPIPATPTASLTPSPVPTVTPTPDFCPNGDCISACVEHLPVIAKPGENGKGIKGSFRVSESSKRYMLVFYSVVGDNILDPQDNPDIPKNTSIYQKDRSSQKKIWEYFTALIPPAQRKFLNEYDIFTDGTNNVLAAVSQSQTDMGKWVLSVDPVDASDPKDLTYTLIHEYGHLLTLNSTQVTPSRRIFDNPHSESVYQLELDACKTYFVGEGCSLSGSYINQFYARFWPDIYDEWQKVDAIQNREDFYVALEAFYKKYQDQFVTDYAPTDPAEDIAESFSFFMLKPKPADKTIADQKVLFFYQFPELIDLRSQIARRLCDQLNK